VVPTFRNRHERWGTLFWEGAVEVKINFKGSGRGRPLYMCGAVAAQVNSRFLTGPLALFGMTKVSLGWLYAALKRRSSTVVSAFGMPEGMP
jgi:hypothetical protein